MFDQRITTYAYDSGGRLTGITANAGTFSLPHHSCSHKIHHHLVNTFRRPTPL
jgi:hypothetical protein